MLTPAIRATLSLHSQPHPLAEDLRRAVNLLF
jgi:hypothetical protein